MTFAPLQGIRVVEVATGVAVPLVGAVFTNLGAEVIKVESRRKPDINRVRIKSRHPGIPGAEGEDFFLLHECNPGKKSVTLNLKTDEGKGHFCDIVAASDVLIQNYAPGWLERLGLSVEALRERNPSLIVLSGSSYGQAGPRKDQRAYAPIMTALGGAEGLVGYEDGEVTGMLATAYADFNAAYYGAFLALGALYSRARTDEGCAIDLSFIECVVAAIGEAVVGWQTTGEVPGARGNRSDSHAPHGAYPARGDDRWVVITVRSDDEWRAMARALRENGAGDWPADARWNTVGGRLAGRAALDAALAEWTAARDDEEIARLLQAAGVAAAPVLAMEDLGSDPHFASRRLVQRVHHPLLGTVEVSSMPWRFNADVLPVRGAAPLLGSSTAEVLEALSGVSGDDLRALEERGALE
jgi:crotonobetainyl-CoA:carnitine CoA-transferase CaiB-like acyl-CoA transferase